jgi:hypothetical protein
MTGMGSLSPTASLPSTMHSSRLILLTAMASAARECHMGEPTLTPRAYQVESRTDSPYNSGNPTNDSNIFSQSASTSGSRPPATDPGWGRTFAAIEWRGNGTPTY